MRHHNDSYFTGTLLEYLGMMLVIFLSGVFSLGLAAPWAFCYRERWVARHTYIEGRQLHFVGKSFDLWLFLLKWTFFSPDFGPLLFCCADPFPAVAHQKYLCLRLLGRILRDGITTSSKQKTPNTGFFRYLKHASVFPTRAKSRRRGRAG